MERFKTFGQFINESKQDNIVNVILDSLEPTIIEMVAATEKWFVEKFEQEFTKYDRELARLNLIFDMVKAVETYTQPTDSLLSLNVSKSAKGNIEISAQIQRDGTTYIFNTEAIYAGGHNIQRLHYRYIVKTNIPKTGVSTITKEYTDKIKKMSKLEKINKEILHFQSRLEKNNSEIYINSKKSDKDIIEIISEVGYGRTSNGGWYASQLMRSDWNKLEDNQKERFNNSESEFNTYQDEMTQNGISAWKSRNIKWKEEDVKVCHKNIAQLQKKLDDIIS